MNKWKNTLSTLSIGVPFGFTNITIPLDRINYIGCCINDTIIHLVISEKGFGGVRESGIGFYQGKTVFDTFSHLKSIVNKKILIDLPMRYQPYNKQIYEKLLRLFLK